jgi:excisionase family DNA binding protein
MLSTQDSQASPHSSMGDDRVITIYEAAQRTGCSVATLKRCNKRGELRILKLSPRRIGVRLSDLKAFLDTRTA